MILYPYPKIFADQVIHIKNDSAFLWFGDRTKELKGKDFRNLEYSKSIRYFEDECNMDEEIEDRDEELIKRYKKKWRLNHDTIRCFVQEDLWKKINGALHLTNAAVLLFTENIQ